MTKLFIIGIGGFIGSVSRYVLNGVVRNILGKPYFPFGTLAVNIIGCLLIGFLGGFSENRQVFSPEIRLFIFIGLLGGFTTFSTFGYEVFNSLKGGHMMFFFLNIVLHLILGIAAVWFGYSLSKMIG